MSESVQSFGPLVARVAVAAIFVQGGFAKLAAPAATAGYIAGKGLPAPMLLAVAAGLLELLGGLALVAGIGTRWTGAALAVYLIPVTLIFHNPAGLEAAAARMQTTQQMKNLAIFGGLVALASFGAGPLSLDSRMRRGRSEEAPGDLPHGPSRG